MADVVIYTRQGCGYCTMAKRLLDGRDVAYVERDATGKPEVRSEMIQRANGRNTFPQVFIDGQSVGGCDDLYDLADSGKLDRMLGVKATKP